MNSQNKTSDFLKYLKLNLCSVAQFNLNLLLRNLEG